MVRTGQTKTTLRVRGLTRRQECLTVFHRRRTEKKHSHKRAFTGRTGLKNHGPPTLHNGSADLNNHEGDEHKLAFCFSQTSKKK